MFNLIVGHEKIKEFFRNALKNNRLFSTYLFKGREGIGKKLTAKVVAAMILCENKQNAPCGYCKHCLKIKEMIENPETQNPHLDLIEIKPKEGKNEITVEDIEKILTMTNFPPYEGKARIFIIDDCHLMNTTSANMILKTLEEPPENTFFFLITSKPDSLLPTILSRCQQVNFSPFGLEELMEIPGLSKEEIKSYIKSGGGFARSADEIEEAKEEKQVAVTVIKSVIDNSSFLKAEEKILEQIEGKSREEINKIFFVIYTMLRDILALKKEENDLANLDFKTELNEIADKVSADFVLELFEIVKKIQTGLFYNLKPIQLFSLIITEGRRIKV